MWLPIEAMGYGLSPEHGVHSIVHEDVLHQTRGWRELDDRRSSLLALHTKQKISTITADSSNNLFGSVS